MSIRFILSIGLTAIIATSTIGCGGGDELSVVQPDEAFLEQLQAEEDLEKSGGTAIRK